MDKETKQSKNKRRNIQANDTIRLTQVFSFFRLNSYFCIDDCSYQFAITCNDLKNIFPGLLCFFCHKKPYVAKYFARQSVQNFLPADKNIYILQGFHADGCRPLYLCLEFCPRHFYLYLLPSPWWDLLI